jgi:mono/diheme cytochrome c family protein
VNAVRVALAVALVLQLTACERTFRDMYDQPRYKPLAASPVWPDGRASRPEPPGSIARSEGTVAGASSGRKGTAIAMPPVASVDTVRDELRSQISDGASHSLTMPAITLDLLQRGRDRFDVFCSPCHSIAGDGDGMVARRGFPHPPSFHIERLRNASDTHFYAVITNGYGAMHSYATRVAPADRIAIVAYIRALQLSQRAPPAMLSDDDRAKLTAQTSSTGLR